ncbi:MAG TPA: GNAT family N-acetyltransferase [Tepidisphaeraceae bacterium]|jgi:GNAT superfamily N-acetyltransferase
MELSISKVKESEIPELLALVFELAIYEKITDWFVATEDSYRESLFGPNAVAEALLARADDKAIGYAIFFENFSSFIGRRGIFLEDIYVQPAHRGKGVGKKMLLTVAEIAKERNCGRLEWTVLNWNKPAIDFYESIGAEAMKEWTIYRMHEKDIARFTEQGSKGK